MVRRIAPAPVGVLASSEGGQHGFAGLRIELTVDAHEAEHSRRERQPAPFPLELHVLQALTPVE